MLAEKLNKVNAHDPSRGQTALIWTAEGHVDVGLVLIERGTDVRARSKAEFTALLNERGS
jgi:hypothetical protein